MVDPTLDATTSVRVIYLGHVQGVGFRYTTNHIARRYAVTGYVKNLPDGTVELIASGRKSVVDHFLDEIDAVFVDHIQDRKIAAIGEMPLMEGFAIRRH